MKNRTYRYYEGEALFPFGFGLSYARFAYTDVRYENGAVTVTVQNTGDCDADEVTQVYVKDHDSPFAVRNYSLCAFKRLSLRKGKKVTVSLPIPERAFQAIDDDGQPTSTGKRFTLYVGGSQPDARSVCLLGAKPQSIEIHR